MDPVVTTEWLAKHLGESDLRVVDGTWHMQQAKRDARAEFEAAHVPGATFFDIDAISDRSTTLPHMLPPAAQFGAAVGALGIGGGDRVVVYDVRGVVSAARVWWTFRAFGHDAVAVLDGGLKKWRAEGRPVERGAPSPRAATFTARARSELVRDVGAPGARRRGPRHVQPDESRHRRDPRVRPRPVRPHAPGLGGGRGREAAGEPEVPQLLRPSPAHLATFTSRTCVQCAAAAERQPRRS